jgi:hypothetical protein
VDDQDARAAPLLRLVQGEVALHRCAVVLIRDVRRDDAGRGAQRDGVEELAVCRGEGVFGHGIDRTEVRAAVRPRP